MGRLFFIFSCLLTLTAGTVPRSGLAQENHHEHHHEHHEMQHGFVLSDDDLHGSHLVANGHHSRQVSILGKLSISNTGEENIYHQQKKENRLARKSYFLFQAQHLDLPTLKAGQVLLGHIVESPIGDYTPKNIIVKEASFVVSEVPVNVINPFFTE